MRKLIYVLFVLLIAMPAFSDSITLNQVESLSVNTSSKIGDWRITDVSQTERRLVVRYYWVDGNGEAIYIKGRRTVWQTWECRDIEVEGTNAECTAASDPFPCCTGAGTGTCDDMIDTCFSDVFLFEIRAQDVGTTIGGGLKQLIWNEMKQDILTGGNDGTFD